MLIAYYVQNFIDLAGSERASQALSAGARLKEGCHINRSLLTLGTVIRKLRCGSDTSADTITVLFLAFATDKSLTKQVRLYNHLYLPF